MTTTPEAGDEPWPDRPHLRDSRQLCWDRIAATATAHEALGDLLTELEGLEVRQRARRADDRARLQAALGAVALDLFVAAGDNPDQYLAYSRRNDDFTVARKRYVHPQVTPTAVRKVAALLEEGGYADGKRGWFSQERGSGYRSRLRATDKLVSFFAGRGVTLADVGVREDAEVIRLKGPAAFRGGQKPLVGYTDKPETERMRRDLLEWTEVANRHDIRPGGDARDLDGRPEVDDDYGTGEIVDPHRARLYRVFNNNRWDAGGRFYGGWWLRLSSEARKRITIDGEPVVELDFKALHPRLAYHLVGQPLPLDDDPYDLGPEWSRVARGDIKVAFNKLLAVGPGGRPKKPKDLTLPRGCSYPKLLKALEDKHRPIQGWLRAGRALELQRLDSIIAEKVMGYFTAAMERPVLPVHDSFIVAKRDEYKLGETMYLAYWATLKDLSGVHSLPVVKGWTPGAGVEERVQAILASVVDDEDDL
jgi:hypothetical protein